MKEKNAGKNITKEIKQKENKVAINLIKYDGKDGWGKN